LVAAFVTIEVTGCGSVKGPEQAGAASGGGSPAAAPAQPPGIKQIMHKVAGGPMSLNAQLDRELKLEKPPWETIQSQSAEYVKLTTEMGTIDPPRGSKDSWTKLTSEFTAAATTLEKAASAKDSTAAKTAHKGLLNSCGACHRDHRPQPPGANAS
jgi:hypothetical protein